MTSLNHTSVNGGSASHWLHQGRLTGHLRVARQLDFGGDFRLYLRDSGYSIGLFESVRETVPEVRLYGTWVVAPGRDGVAPLFY